MPIDDLAYVVLVLLFLTALATVPSLVALRGAGRRTRALLVRQAWAMPAVIAGVVGWLGLGLFVLSSAPHRLNLYRGATLFLLGAGTVLLVVGVQTWARAAKTARETDRGATAEAAQ